MTSKAKINNLVADVIAGTDVPSAWEHLRQCGQRGTDAILDAMEGKLGRGKRHLRDLHEDLISGLQAIAKVNPAPLIVALDGRPRHTFSLIWALGASRQKVAVDKLIDHVKHQDKWVRWAAVCGLARFSRKSLLPPLLLALRDRSNRVRFVALEGLTKVADRTAIEPLKRYLTNKRLKPGARRIATELLNKLETETAINLGEVWAGL